MEVANYKGLVSLREALNPKGQKRWLIVYGLQVLQATNFDKALEDFTNCVKHAAECEGYYD